MMSQGTSSPHWLGSHRALLFLATAWVLREGPFVAALTPPTARPNSKRLELQSSGGFIQVAGGPSKAVAGGADSATSFVWPEAATDKHEVNLGRLKGGTHPVKVKIGSNVFVRKKVLEGDTQAIMMEALTNHLYEAAQIKSEHCRYYPGPAVEKSTAASAKPTALMLCRFIDGLNPVFDFNEKVKKAVSENFVLDAVFANYDVGGTQGSNKDRYPRGNVGWDSDNNLVRIDNGGALAADGLGDWKATTYKCKDRLFDRMVTWSPEPFQLWDFQRTSDIYLRLSKEDIVSQVAKVMAKEKDILAAVDNFEGGAASQRVKATLKARLECLGRIAKDRADLLEHTFMQVPTYDHELPSDVCDGVRKLCADLLEDKAHSSP